MKWKPGSTFHVRQSGSEEMVAECPTMGSADELAKAMVADKGGQWLVIRTTGRLTAVVRRFGGRKP